LALDVTGAYVVDGANIQIFERNNTNAQKWDLQESDPYEIFDGTYVLVSKMSGRALDVSGAGTSDGTSIQTWVRNNTAAQNFIITRMDNEYYTLKNTNSGKYVDVSGAGTSDGTKIQIWIGNGTCAQMWRIEHIANGYYVFTSMCSGKAMDMSGYDKNGAVTHLWTRDDNNINQLWSLVRP
jgi:hypothetical protein